MNKFKFSIVATSAFAGSLLLGGLAVNGSNSEVIETFKPTAKAHASWANSAETIAEQVNDSTLVVRAQVVDRAMPRGFEQPVPNGAEQRPLLFTDSQIEVLEVFSGKAEVGDRLWVMQTGGDFMLKSGEVNRVELEEDPLYRVADEMILFLVDISGDSVHAADRQLYRTVNPAGRFQVQGNTVRRMGEHTADKSSPQLRELSALSQAIESAVADRQRAEG